MRCRPFETPRRACGKGRRRERATGRARGERGTVTAELALALPVVVLLLAVLLDCGRTVLAQVRCVDAARAAARAAARSEPVPAVQALAMGLAPLGSTVVVGRGQGLVRVEVSGSVRVSGPVPPVPVRCTAVARAELP